jgi:hypothetical protein
LICRKYAFKRSGKCISFYTLLGGDISRFSLFSYSESTAEEMGAEWALEKQNIYLSSKVDNQTETVAKEFPSGSEEVCPKRMKPRALIFKANYKDFDKIIELIKTQFPEVEIIYATTGPTASILRVIKSVPFETQDSSTQPLYTVE